MGVNDAFRPKISFLRLPIMTESDFPIIFALISLSVDNLLSG